MVGMVGLGMDYDYEYLQCCGQARSACDFSSKDSRGINLCFEDEREQMRREPRARGRKERPWGRGGRKREEEKRREERSLFGKITTTSSRYKLRATQPVQPRHLLPRLDHDRSPSAEMKKRHRSFQYWGGRGLATTSHGHLTWARFQMDKHASNLIGAFNLHCRTLYHFHWCLVLGSQFHNSSLNHSPAGRPRGELRGEALAEMLQNTTYSVHRALFAATDSL